MPGRALPIRGLSDLHEPLTSSAPGWEPNPNRLGYCRRNLSPEQMSLLRGRIYNRSKKAHGGDRKSAESKDQFDPLIESKSTAEVLAEKHGVSAPTIKRDGQFAASVEALKEFNQERAPVSG